MSDSRIEWTDTTWNPVTGCTKVSAGCDNCYMFRQYPRLRGMGVNGYDRAPDVVQLLPDRVDQPRRWTRPRRVFVNSMSDLFHPDVPYAFINRVFTTMAETPAHEYQVLTKRPGRANHWWERTGHLQLAAWPPNVLLGVSVESQQHHKRVRMLERLPAPVRFVSAEPLLGPLDLMTYLVHGAIQWVIAGGESGPGARPMDLEWARTLRDQCAWANVPFFLKQLGGARNKRGGNLAMLDGRTHTEQAPEPPLGAHSAFSRAYYGG